MSSLDEVRAAVHNAGGASGWALGALVRALAAVAASGDDRLGLDTLGAVPPLLLIRISDHVRRDGRVPSGTGPVGVALASLARDGRVRERAVATLLAAPGPAAVPLLVMRAADPVSQVRDRARAGLALLLADDPAGYLAAAFPTALVTEARRFGRYAVALVTAALLQAGPAAQLELLDSSDAATRRRVFDLGLGFAWWTCDALVVMAESDRSRRIRVLAAGAVCRDAVWTNRGDVLRRLARSRYGEVRATAVTGLLRTGQIEEATRYLADPAALVRPIARVAARRLGLDASAHYRAALVPTDSNLGGSAAPAPTDPHPGGSAAFAGAVAGLAETGSAEDDGPQLEALLAHDDRRVRAAAVRGLRTLGAVDTARLVPMLRDPAPAVVREAALALRNEALPAGLAWELLGDDRRELRRAGYLLLGRQPVRDRLKGALMLAADPDSKLASRAGADAVRLAREVMG